MDKVKETELQAAAEPTPDEAVPEDGAERAPASADKRMREDIALLKELFPALKADDIPDEVWEKVQNGETLAASYALYFLQSVKEKERIEKLNDENSKKAVPRVKSDQASEPYFSPETVKSMSPGAVRKHYAAILKSMDSWN